MMDTKQRKAQEIGTSSVGAVKNFMELDWSSVAQRKRLSDRLSSHTGGKDGFDLILGADLIYSLDTVEPLLSTAAHLLSSNDPKATFLLAQSFAFDEETEAEIDRICQLHGLSKTIVSDHDCSSGGCRIVEFRHCLR